MDWKPEQGQQQLMDYHKVFASTLGNILQLMGDPSTATDKTDVIVRNVMKACIIYAMTMRKDEAENKKDFAALKANPVKFFQGEDGKPMLTWNLLILMVEKQAIAGLTPSNEIDTSPYETYNAIAYSEKRFG